MGWMIRGLNPSRSNICICSVKCPDQLWILPSLLFSGYQGLLTGVRRPWCETDHLSPSSAYVMNEWSCTSTSSICHHGAYRDSFAFTYCVGFIRFSYKSLNFMEAIPLCDSIKVYIHIYRVAQKNVYTLWHEKYYSIIVTTVFIQKQNWYERCPWILDSM